MDQSSGTSILCPLVSKWLIGYRRKYIDYERIRSLPYRVSVRGHVVPSPRALKKVTWFDRRGPVRGPSVEHTGDCRMALFGRDRPTRPTLDAQTKCCCPLAGMWQLTPSGKTNRFPNHMNWNSKDLREKQRPGRNRHWVTTGVQIRLVRAPPLDSEKLFTSRPPS
jgi:hypothetical protein